MRRNRLLNPVAKAGEFADHFTIESSPGLVHRQISVEIPAHITTFFTGAPNWSPQALVLLQTRLSFRSTQIAGVKKRSLTESFGRVQNRLTPYFRLTQIFFSFRFRFIGNKRKNGVPSLTFYKGTRHDHWLRDKFDEGRIVLLEDESMWEVQPSDRSRVAQWLRISTITVEHTQQDIYPYVLTNSTERETARANYLGEFEYRCNEVA